MTRRIGPSGTVEVRTYGVVYRYGVWEAGELLGGTLHPFALTGRYINRAGAVRACKNQMLVWGIKPPRSVETLEVK